MQKGFQIAKAPSLATSWKHRKKSRWKAKMVVIGGRGVVYTSAGFSSKIFECFLKILLEE